MKAVVCAYHDIGCVGIRALLDAGFEISAVFTHRDNPEEQHFFASVAHLCAQRRIPVYAPEDINTGVWIAHIEKLAPDYIFSFYYRNLLAEELLAIPAQGAYNLHGSLLPAYRGRAPVNWVLINGETRTGVTLHRMTKRPDAGAIAAQREVLIDADETALTLHAKQTAAAAQLLSENLADFMSANVQLQPQDDTRASYFGRRRPADGELDWSLPVQQLERLVRAVTDPYPGAFSYSGDRKLTVWASTSAGPAREPHSEPGTVVCSAPLQIACADGVLEVSSAQIEGGLPMAGAQLSTELGLMPGMRLGLRDSEASRAPKRTKVLILGVNGFIGNHLVERLLEAGHYDIYGMDISAHTIDRFLDQPNFHFVEGDISIHREWIEYHIKKCDVVLPLVAIATPIEYVRNPLRVFELDFEENLKIVRYCVKYGKRIIFPSTSEVYGMCEDDCFDEDRSSLIVGPINKQRWIYSASKQLLDRIIYAYGVKEGLQFTLFRPFNWMGPRLDSLDSARIGSSRAITQLILNLVSGTPIQLVDGGAQKRCFTDIDDGIEALFGIIENKGGRCDGQIINIGNPDNEASIRELADMLMEKFERHSLRDRFPPLAGVRVIESSSYYGNGYQDVSFRRPSIENARRALGWQPRIPLEQTVDKTLSFFLSSAVEDGRTP